MGATPQFTKNGIIGSITVTAANVKSDGAGTGIGTDIFKCVTADATYGTFIEYLRWIATATVAATATTLTTGRVFASSITSGATASTDTYLIAEVALPATTADHSTTPVNPIDVPLNFRLPAGWTLLLTNHFAPATNTAWRGVAVGGDY